MDRLTALTLALCVAGCAAVPHAASSAAIDEVKVAAYDAPLSVVLDAVRDVAMTRFHRVTVSPRERAVWTNWQWTYGGPEESFLRPPERINLLACTRWGRDCGDVYLGKTLWRVDVSVAGDRPWRIKVKPHLAQEEDDPDDTRYGQSGLEEIKDPAWLQQYADAFLAQVHEQLRPFAVTMPEPPRSNASLDASSPPLPPREIVGPPSQIVVELDTSKRHIDRYRLNGLSRQVAFIEGATIDDSSRAAIGGVVMTCSIPGKLDVLQTASDETGYYRFDNLKPGVYSISAWYSVGHRGQIEVRRSNIEVEGGEISIVPILVDMRRP